MTNHPRIVVAVTETTRVRRPPEAVFDFTQDYAIRPEWDRSVTSASMLSEEPRRVRVTLRGVGEATLEYRLFRRPERTSAAFTDVRSRLVAGGGGSWSYEPSADGTVWTQTNTIELRATWYARLIAPIVQRNLRRGMRQAADRARARLEAGASATGARPSA